MGMARLLLCCCMASLPWCGSARADTPVTLLQTWTGNVNFSGGQQTMRGNDTDCSMASPTKDLVIPLRNIPSGSTILSAQLYWAGSNIDTSANYTVTFAGKTITATRQYFSHTIGSGYDYFGAAVDVTALVKGNGDYHVKGLVVNNGAPWCKGQGVLGGYSLLAVYSNKNEAYRVLNVYEGFEYLRNSSITITTNNFKVPATTATTHIGQLAWGGEKAISPGEKVEVNGNLMTSNLNPAGNNFNSTSTLGADDDKSFGIDLDDYLIDQCLCQAGLTSATTVFQTGQDMILFQMGVLAIPSVPTSDLKLAMARGSELVVGGNTAYTLTVSNGGPEVEGGPVTVTDTLPAGLQYVGASGADWTCSASGQVVTCTSTLPLDRGASLAPITLTARVTASGTFTNSAQVAGANYDYAPANNSASDTASTPGSFMFTNAACVAGKAIGAADQPCSRFKGPVTAGRGAAVYVTAIDANMVPVAVSTTASATATVRLALSCIKPSSGAGVGAAYAGAALPVCTAGGVVPDPAGAGWSAAVTLTFPANSPTAQLTTGFLYEDVGQVLFSLVDAAGKVSSTSFVVRPARLSFVSIRRTRDGVANPGATDGTGTGFARAGEPFTLEVAALTASGRRAPNFGNAGSQITLQQQQQGNLPAVQGGFDTLQNGVISGANFSWHEAGVIVLTPQLAGDDYLGTGPVPGQSASIGRFYPDHFETAPSAAFPCLPRMACPAGVAAGGEQLEVTGGVYAGQPFAVTVRALGVAGNTLSNYSGEYARRITLAAYDSPGGTLANPGGGTLGTNTIDTVPAGQEAIGHPAYQLPALFSATAPRALNWSAPAAIYLRASATELVAAAGNTTESVTVTSKRASGSVEGGVSVVAGRLNLQNAFGSELLKLPLPMQAQYWTGSGWEVNTADNASSVGGSAAFTQCLRRLNNGAAAPNNCKPVLALLPGAAPVLRNGSATAWLQAPGAGNDGSAMVQMASAGSPWLPSTIGRAAFGIYKGAFVFSREVY